MANWSWWFGTTGVELCVPPSFLFTTTGIHQQPIEAGRETRTWSTPSYEYGDVTRVQRSTCGDAGTYRCS